MQSLMCHFISMSGFFVVALGFYVPPTAKVIRRRALGLKSHPKDWRNPGSNSRPLVYKAGGFNHYTTEAVQCRVKVPQNWR